MVTGTKLLSPQSGQRIHIVDVDVIRQKAQKKSIPYSKFAIKVIRTLATAADSPHESRRGYVALHGNKSRAMSLFLCAISGRNKS